MPFRQVGQKPSGLPDQLTFSAYSFSGGINVKSTAQELDDGDLTSAVNVRLRTDGGVEQRKGYSNVNGPLTLTSPGSNPTYGSVRFNQTLVAGAISTQKWLLQQYGATGVGPGSYLINSSTGAVPAGVTNPFATNTSNNGITNWTTAVITDPNGGSAAGAQSNGGPAGPLAYGTSDTLVIACGGDGPYFWDGVHQPYAPNGTGGIAAPGAAQGATLVQVVNNIVFFAGCPKNPNIVFATSLYVAAVAGTGPEYYYQSFRMSYPVTSLGVIGSGAQAALVVGTRKTLSLIYGTYPGNYTVQDIPVNDGPITARCNVSIAGLYFFLGNQAFYVFDGQSAPQRLTDKIEPWILGDSSTSNPSFPMLGNRLSYWAYYYNNRIGLVYDSTGGGLLNTILVYDLVNKGWTVYQTYDPFISFAALDGPGDPSPIQGVKFSQSSGAQWFWDVYSTGFYAADSYNGTTGQNIAATFQTKYYKVGLPGTPKILMRAYPEIFAGSATPLNFNVINNYGNGTTSTIALPQLGSPAAYYDGAGSFVAKYDNASNPVTTWGSGQLSFFGAPQTRLDFNLSGEAFSFGLSSSTQLQPWVWQGLTGSYSQRAQV